MDISNTNEKYLGAMYGTLRNTSRSKCLVWVEIINVDMLESFRKINSSPIKYEASSSVLKIMHKNNEFYSSRGWRKIVENRKYEVFHKWKLSNEDWQNRETNPFLI